MSESNGKTNGAVAHGEPEAKCPFEEILQLIGSKWKLVILWHLRGGPQRYAELKREIPTVSSKVLSRQLKELVDSGFIARHAEHEGKPPVYYELTELGESLRIIQDALLEWCKAQGLPVGECEKQRSA